MKKLISLLIIALFTTAGFAQDYNKDTKQETKEATEMSKEKMAAHKGHECYMMKENTVIHCMGDKADAQKSDVKLSNGTVITSTGMVKMKDGNTKQLENGQCVSMMGSIGDCETMHSTMKSPKKAEGTKIEEKKD